MNRGREPMVADDGLLEPPPTEAPERFTLRITWRLQDIDYPNCLSHFVLDYYDTLYNESSFTR